MTTSRRALVIAAFETQLALINTQAAGAGTTVTLARSDDDAIAETKLPKVVMVPGGQDKNSEAVGGEVTGRDTYSLRMPVYGYVSAATDSALDDAISDLYARIVKAILTDRTLGGLAEYVRESAMDDPDWDHEKARRPNAAFMVHFDIDYITKQGDPFSLPS